MKLYSVLFALVFLIQSPLSSAKKLDTYVDSEVDFWKSTQLDYEFLSQNITRYCNESPTYVQACMSALNSLSGALATPVAYATDSEKQQGSMNLGKQVQVTPYGLNQYEVASPEFKLKTEWLEAMRKTRKIKQISAMEIFLKKFNLPFLELYKTHIEKLIEENPFLSREYIIGQVTNAYLEVAVDPHTYIMPAQQFSQGQSGEAEEFGGIGVRISEVNGRIMISDFIEGSASEEAGVLIGDEIVAVESESMEGASVARLVKALRGKEGSIASLTLKRGEKTLIIPVTRKIYRLENVEYRVVQDAGNRYGYIQIRAFSARNTGEQTRAAVTALLQQNIQGFILDLRGNPGGDITQSEEVSAIFVGKKRIVSLKTLDQKREQVFTGKRDAMTDLPVVTLIDGNSASASEIVSGALQDYQRSWVVGDRSYGKGSAQSVLPAELWLEVKAKDTVNLLITLNRFYQPTGRSNQAVGIIPDFKVLPFPGATAEDQFVLREEDRYANALPVIGQAWSQTRPDAVAQIEQCRSQNGKADTLYRKFSQSGKRKPDYRLYVAEDILNCATR